MKTNELKAFSRRVSDQLFGHILPFWTGPALDHEQGGWLPWMSNDLRVDRSQPKGLILNSRILWTFSAVHRFRPDPLYRRMADRAFDFVMHRFWDQQHGGAFWRLDATGRVLACNERASSLLEVSERFLTGKPLVLFIDESSRPEFFHHVFPF